MIKAVVFDFDGLILDTETPEFASFQQIYREHGAELTLAVWGDCIGAGPTAFNPYEHLERCIGRPIEREAVRARRRALYEETMQTADLRPGVLAYLDEARDMGLSIGLASSSKEGWVRGYLDRYSLTDRFHCIRTADHVSRVKPDPELYLAVLKALHVRPEEAVAFEDSPNGALAAQRAGLHCVIVPNSITAFLTFGLHDLRIESMSEMKLRDVLNRLQNEEVLKLGDV